jgi:hypothetical protein
MSYYGAGDYYGAGGIFDFLGGAVRTGVSLLTGGPGAAVRTGLSQIRGGGGGGMPKFDLPGLGAPGVRVGPFMSPAYAAAATKPRRYWTKDGRPRRIRKDGKPYGIPSMDPGNARALRRASRRIDRFVGVARSALKHTNYKIASKSSRARARK